MLVLKIKKNLGKGRHYFLLDLDLIIQEHARRIVFFGPSGSGKTLSLRCLAGLVTPDQGLIKVDGTVLFDSASGINIIPQKRHMGYMPQDYALFPHLTLLENVAYPKSGLWARFIKKKEKKDALALLTRFGLEKLAGNLPCELSGGQKQRAALARAFNSKASLLLLDEPFAALDPLLRHDLRFQLLELLKESNLPLVVITHDPADVDAFAQSVVLFCQGRVNLIANYQEERQKFPDAVSCLLLLQEKFKDML